MREISARLTVEECTNSSRSSDPDAERQYVVHSKHFLAEGEIYITCRPSRLDETLRQVFKTDLSSRYVTGSGYSYYANSSFTQNRKERRFLTRDPIYAPPNGEVHELLKDVGKVIMGRDPGVGYDLFCEMIDEMISPPKKNY